MCFDFWIACISVRHFWTSVLPPNFRFQKITLPVHTSRSPLARTVPFPQTPQRFGSFPHTAGKAHTIVLGPLNFSQPQSRHLSPSKRNTKVHNGTRSPLRTPNTISSLKFHHVHQLRSKVFIKQNRLHRGLPDFYKSEPPTPRDPRFS